MNIFQYGTIFSVITVLILLRDLFWLHDKYLSLKYRVQHLERLNGITEEDFNDRQNQSNA